MTGQSVGISSKCVPITLLGLCPPCLGRLGNSLPSCCPESPSRFSSLWPVGGAAPSILAAGSFERRNRRINGVALLLKFAENAGYVHQIGIITLWIGELLKVRAVLRNNRTERTMD